MFLEKCDRCGTEYIRQNAVGTVGLKRTGRVCERKRIRGHCRYVQISKEIILPCYIPTQH